MHAASLHIRCFDRLRAGWESPRLRPVLGTGLALAFLGAVLLIEANRRHLLPAPAAGILPVNHLAAVRFAFTLLLVVEVLSLIFTLAQSVSVSLGKQFEVLSLILLRDTFKEFAEFTEPLAWPQIGGAVGGMAAAAAAALVIFVVLGLYYRALRRDPMQAEEADCAAFVAAKKGVALALLAAFTGMGLLDLGRLVMSGGDVDTFASFYTLLIFSDILIVLLSLRYGSGYRMAFRNSAFAVSTVFIRLALMAPVAVAALLGAGTALFALGVVAAFNHFAPALPPDDTEPV
ncbi:hypothetical protein G3N55_05935 [Dissulfurirhabdus thermomarina]|uniref:Uncharacterized protein n=1 Tax=Dissulfurirhabdus thermomarina TaxID=1765737 RepID=A0A6N9TM73_DISTH|nr:hypothetical protein [Dissulfurirhabdus thermomarina]NDY42381.1 hypothetical protein [Dissulfurirhabdus thermomarina]NMX24317.1 hypothetical protein [Dissulfurirhabdus thermomarina]